MANSLSKDLVTLELLPSASEINVLCASDETLIPYPGFLVFGFWFFAAS